ncbi:MAG: stalk domain-containing protein [Zhenhengia sp.]|uniref:stalk domain-containing protein n=1 Tax=Zhenhengia sp. TaxID=2944208 RepID=UPI00399277E6
MKKNLINSKALSKLFMVLVTIFMFTTTVFAAETDIAIYINGKHAPVPSSMGLPFIDSQARTQVPLRFVSESLGHKVEWDEKKQQAKIDGGNVVVTVGSYDVKTPNGTIKMDTKAVKKDDRVFVPVRFISEALGHKVDYKYANGVNCVMISTGEGVILPEESKPNVDGSGVNSYEHPKDQFGYDEDTKHWIDYEQFGYNRLNTKTRAAGTPWMDDIKYLSSLMGTYMQVAFAQDGMLAPGNYTTGGQNEHGDPGSYTYITEFEAYPESRVVATRFWPLKNASDYSKSQVFIHNLFMECVRYFSQSPSDGNQIIAYINGQVAKNKYPEFNTPMTFGQTTVVFERLSKTGFGFNVCFNEWPDSIVK